MATTSSVCVVPAQRASAEAGQRGSHQSVVGLEHNAERALAEHRPFLVARHAAQRRRHALLAQHRRHARRGAARGRRSLRSTHMPHSADGLQSGVLKRKACCSLAARRRVRTGIGGRRAYDTSATPGRVRACACAAQRTPCVGQRRTQLRCFSAHRVHVRGRGSPARRFALGTVQLPTETPERGVYRAPAALRRARARAPAREPRACAAQRRCCARQLLSCNAASRRRCLRRARSRRACRVARTAAPR